MQKKTGGEFMNLVIVGAGKGGLNLIDYFSSVKGIHISLVIDKDLNAPGIIAAKNLGINYSQNIEDIDCDNTDIIIEATGIDSVAKILNDNFSNTCTVIDSKSALLIMALAEKNIETLESLNHQISVIENTSEIVQKQIEEISTSITNIHHVSDSLLKSTQISNKYINESDNIVRSVNKIAHQTKILGINASIEAARAGEHGKGFSIVAREVQNLAKYSQDFADEISQILLRLANELNSINNEVSKLTNLSDVQLNASNEVTSAVDILVKTCKSN